MQTRMPFLHTPSRDPGAIANYLATKKEENETLDFKCKVDKVPDLATDIAALANNRGGDLVIGITEENDRASLPNYISDSDLPDALKRVTDALDLLRPGDFKSSVIFEPPVRFAVDQNMLVVSVPPSPDLVCVKQGRDLISPIRVRHPVRVGSHTKYLEYEEVMQRSRAAARTMYLKLRHLEQQLAPGIQVRISSQFGAVNHGGFVPAAIIEQRQAHLKLLGPLTLTLSMIGSQAFSVFAQQTGYQSPAAVSIGAIQADQELQVPYELIRAAWVEKSGNTEYLSIALDGASVVWNGTAWRVIVG